MYAAVSRSWRHIDVSFICAAVFRVFKLLVVLTAAFEGRGAIVRDGH